MLVPGGSRRGWAQSRDPNAERPEEPSPKDVPPSEEGRSGDLGPPPPVFRDLTGSGGPDREPPPPYEASQRGGPGRRWWPRILILVVILMLALIVANIAIGLYIDRLWFSELDYRGVFNTRIGARLWLFFAGFGIALVYLLGSMTLAWRLPVEATGEPRSPLRDFSPGAVRRVMIIVTVVAAAFMSIILGAIASGQWERILQFINAEPFGLLDRQFNRDVGFYVFKLEALQFIKGWGVGLTIVTALATVAVYGYRYLTYGGNVSATRPVRIHLAVLLTVIIGLFVWGYWLARFELAVSENGTVFGATFTDVNARSVVFLVLMAVGGVVGLALLSWPFHRRLLVPGGALGLLVLVSIGGLLIYPAIVQRVTVEPNELSREREFIARNIEATRFAFGLDAIEERQFPANDAVTPADVETNPEALRNLRLWDHRPLNDTLNTIQTIRPLYVFPDVDVDRYEIGGETRQVFLAARELSQGNLPPGQESWVNSRLQFTHGFGVTVNPVDAVTGAGQPEFVVSNIPPQLDGVAANEGSALARFADATAQPRIYFGEATNSYVIVNSEEEEFDFPLSGGGGGEEELALESQARNRYDGSGGVKVGGFFKRLAFAWEFADTNILISGAIDGDSRILFRRNIQERVRQLAPFLTLDADPYVVIGLDGRLYWIQDAYTTSDRMPYSQPHSSGVNYIRNSVKAVISTFDGTVDLYIVDDVVQGSPRDPIVRVWEKIFPELFRPSSAFPADLREHWRYPQDLFQIQSDQYLTYHITNPTTLFNREAIWAIPQEVLREQSVPVEPYYVTLRLPDGDEPEFLLILPFTPRIRQNAIAWMAGRSDGEHYGRLFAFRFPADRNVVGPAQVEARIGQEPAVSRQFTLLGQEGSEVIRGNLLFIPVGDSFIYVEPLYVQAETSLFPQLKFVVMVNGDRVALEETLAEAATVALGFTVPPEVLGEASVGEPAPTAPSPPATVEPPADGEAEPRASPPSGEASEDLAGLIAEAQDAFADAQARLAAGDFAGYGKELERLERALDQLTAESRAPP